LCDIKPPKNSFDKPFDREYTSIDMEADHEMDGRLTYDQVVKHNSYAFRKLIEFAQCKGLFLTGIDPETLSDDQLLEAFRPGDAHRADAERVVVRDFAAGPEEQTGTHSRYIAAYCGGVTTTQAYIRFQAPPSLRPKAGFGSGVLLGTFESDTVKDDEGRIIQNTPSGEILKTKTFMMSRF